MKTASIRTVATAMAMGMITGLQASVIEHQPPAPLPEFKTPEQLAKWRSETTARAEAQQASRPSTLDSSTPFYTGKPYLAESRSYAFKYRQYSPEMGRWTTVDPSGFPDGANNRVYASVPTSGLDPNGLSSWDSWDFLEWFYIGEGQTVNLADIGLLNSVRAVAMANDQNGGAFRFGKQIADKVGKIVPYSTSIQDTFKNSYKFGEIVWAMGDGTLQGSFRGNITFNPPTNPGSGVKVPYSYSGTAEIYYSDVFTDPYDILQYLKIKNPSGFQEFLANNPGFLFPSTDGYQLGVPYNIFGSWTQEYKGNGYYIE
jgi:RHS repeat-associated protein